jgi:hypothetical protein
MKTSTDTLVRALRIIASGLDSDGIIEEAADRLEQLTMPNDATFARIVDAMGGVLSFSGPYIPSIELRNAYRAAVKEVES